MLRTPKREAWHPQPPLKDSELVQQSWAISSVTYPTALFSSLILSLLLGLPWSRAARLTRLQQGQFFQHSVKVCTKKLTPKTASCRSAALQSAKDQISDQGQRRHMGRVQAHVMLGYRPMFTLCQKPLQEVAVGCPRWLSHRQLFCFEHG